MDWTGEPSLKTNGFGSAALEKPGMVEATEHVGLVPEGPDGGAEDVEEDEEDDTLVGGGGGGGGAVVAVPGRHWE